MIYTSLAVLALSATAAISPLSNILHLHPHAQTDTRIHLTLRNTSFMYRDVKIDEHSYTIRKNGTVTIKAPAGTRVYADSRTPFFHAGDVILELTPQVNHQTIAIN